jgi:hypothetical protein
VVFSSIIMSKVRSGKLFTCGNFCNNLPLILKKLLAVSFGVLSACCKFDIIAFTEFFLYEKR